MNNMLIVEASMLVNVQLQCSMLLVTLLNNLVARDEKSSFVNLEDGKSENEDNLVLVIFFLSFKVQKYLQTKIEGSNQESISAFKEVLLLISKN